MSMIDNLGYEQLKVLRILRDKPNLEAWTLKLEADCSIKDLHQVANLGLITLDMSRMSAALTAMGHGVLTEALQRLPDL